MPRKSTVLTAISWVSGELYIFIIESCRQDGEYRQAAADRVGEEVVGLLKGI
jgi:hypothetical protein